MPFVAYDSDSSSDSSSGAAQGADAGSTPRKKHGGGHGGVTPCCKQLLDPRLALMASVLLSHLRGRDLMEHRHGPRRRVVSGLREVRELLKAGKQPVLAVFIAYDISENPVKHRCPAREAEMIMTSALAACTPVSFALSRRDMGCALGHPHAVSVTAVLGAEGEERLFGEVMTLSVDLCAAFVTEVHGLVTNNIVRSLVNCVTS
jgi:ribosomal protein L7Ae-like RNA K-turn-binding protein